MRARAFHIMDPKGVVEMLLVFLECRGEGLISHPSLSQPTVSFNTILLISLIARQLFVVLSC